MLVLDSDLHVVRANAAFFRYFDVCADETVGHRLDALGEGQWDVAELATALDAVISRQEPVENFRVEHNFPTLGHRIMLVNANRIAGQSRRPDLILIAITDITESERAREELEGQLEYNNKLIDSVRESLVVLDGKLRVMHANQVFYDTFDLSAEETEGFFLYETGDGQWDIPELRELLENVLPQKKSFDDFEIIHEFDRIGSRHMYLNGRRLDHLDRVILAIEDVTERHRYFRQQEILAGEMSHRVKNVLALVDSIASQTASSSRSLDDFLQNFHGRLNALARSHSQWLAEDTHTVNLTELISETVGNAGVSRERIRLEGPPVIVDNKQTTALNLTFHELATNAAKHGALSTEAGRIDVAWSIDDDRQVHLVWRESDGPPVVSQPAHSFGLKLIESLCPFELKGNAKVRFEPAGLECELRFPLV